MGGPGKQGKKQIGRKKVNVSHVRQKLIFSSSLGSEVNCEVGRYFFEFFHSISS
jgi:hypothetical protein